MTPTTGPRISVVVPTVDRVALLARTLRGLAAQDGVAYEVIVVHDGHPGVRALLDAWAGTLALRALHIPDRGAVAKRNVGWRAARAELVAFTDDDCEPAPGWLKAALEAFDDESVDLVQGRVEPHPEDRAVTGLFRRTIEVHQHYEGYPNANLVYRRRALERVGGYDDAYWGAGEDADLAHRVVESGGGVRYVDDAVVWHAVRAVDFSSHLRSLPRWANAPLTVKRHPQLRELVHHRVFWKRSHTTGFVALVGIALAPLRLRWLALAVPHFVRRMRANGARGGAQLAVADIAEVAVTVAGSIRYRTVFF